MSGSISSSNTLLAATEKAAKANAAASNGASGAATPDGASAAASSAMSSIAGNFNSFLTMLTTQLRNQDPSSPMDSDHFTSEIATFAGVQQQVSTNSNLGQLITLTQNGQAATDANLVGQTATFSGSQIPLQSGTASIAFSTPSPGPVAIAVTDASGNVVRSLQETSAAGSNSWSWDGKDNAGNKLPDGAYGIAVQTADSAGNVTQVPFTSSGKVTGVAKGSGGDILLQLGSASVNMNNVTSVQTGA